MRRDEIVQAPHWLIPDWPSLPCVRALSTLREGGVSQGAYASLNLGAHVGDDAANVAENRRRLTLSAGLPSEPIWLTQVHGNGVRNIDAEAASLAPTCSGLAGSRSVASEPPAADASWTRSRARVCAILTADCLPVLFATQSGDAVAAAHAGWRGLSGGVLEATVNALGVDPATLLVWLGPAIGRQHFEVGPEVREVFLANDAGAVVAFKESSRGRWWADLGLLARLRLLKLGVTHVYGGGECTYAQPERFYSHRREGQTGRQATLIWIERTG